jgi:hypothetical protein
VGAGDLDGASASRVSRSGRGLRCAPCFCIEPSGRPRYLAIPSSWCREASLTSASAAARRDRAAATPPIAHKGFGDRSDVRRPFAAAGPPLLAECIQDEPGETELTPGGLQGPERPPLPPDGEGDVLPLAPERPRAPRPGAWSMSRRCDPTAPADQRRSPTGRQKNAP